VFLCGFSQSPNPLIVDSFGDCLVLSQDISAIPPRALLNTRVEQTIVGGKVVYAAA
jgi:predicted amidohydrolase YtcJ